jgi:alkyldihydroxyacetonephosphate synthase
VLKSTQAATNPCGKGFVTWRLTHIYPDGVAPYYTVIATGEKDREIEQWDRIKEAASGVIVEHGGTITHHHAVGKDHRRWYEQERGPLFGLILTRAKQAVDPQWILNPDVLLEVEASQR